MSAAVMEQPAVCGRRVCAWCVPPRDLGPAPELPAGRTTHGMCVNCQKLVLDEFNRERARRNFSQRK